MARHALARVVHCGDTAMRSTALLLLLLTACVREAVGPDTATRTIVRLVIPSETTTVRVAVPTRLGVEATDRLGRRFVPSELTLVSLDTTVAVVTSMGEVVARRRGYGRLIATVDGAADTAWVHATQIVTSVRIEPDTVRLHSLGEERQLAVTLIDDQGLPVLDSVPEGLAYLAADGDVASLSETGTIRANGNGATLVTVLLGPDTLRAVVVVQQRPVRVELPADTVWFDALGDDHVIAGMAVDALGSRVESNIGGLSVADSTIVRVVGDSIVRPVGNGVTTARFTVGGLPAEVVVQVQQVAIALSASLTFGRPIITLPVGAPVPLTCEATDRNGYAVAGDPFLAAGSAGFVSGATCGTARVARSGHDTLTVTLGQAVTRVAVVVAAAPIPDAPLGQQVVADTLPAVENGPWAPSIYRNHLGEVEVYYAAFSSEPDSTGYTRGDLQRLVWLGGNQFRYDGVALTHDDDICSPQGQGIENIAIVPRAEAPGWRMFYAAGSNACYGWQVFSAVSADGRSWTKEPGVRLANGGTAVQGQPPWPTGEGMVVDQLPSGEWRMIAGTYEHLAPPENRWQVTEWRSPDQLEWSYVGPVLTTRDMPAGWQGSVYSPTIRQLAPGLWRMVFTADGRDGPGGRSAIWSAVSTDRAHWQVEGEVLGAEGVDLYYSTMVDEQIVFIRKDPDGRLRLAIARLIMQ